jgi:hypothetical protein
VKNPAAGLLGQLAGQLFQEKICRVLGFIVLITLKDISHQRKKVLWEGFQKPLTGFQLFCKRNEFSI